MVSTDSIPKLGKNFMEHLLLRHNGSPPAPKNQNIRKKKHQKIF